MRLRILVQLLSNLKPKAKGDCNMNTTQNITLDLTKRTVFQYVSAKQGDNGSRFVKITLTDNGVVYKPPADTAATFRAQKPDGTAILNPAVVNGDGTVTVELTQQTLAVCGDVVADVCLMDKHGTRLSTVSFIIHIENAPVGEQIDSTNEFLKLLEIIERAENITGDFSSALDQLESIRNDVQTVAANLHQTVTSELQKAKESGEFDGPKGDKGNPGDGFCAEDDSQGNVTILSATEVVYPPMLLGVEYKTPEFWNGQPVYTELVDFGELPLNTEKSVAHKIKNITHVVRCAGTTTFGNSIPWAKKYQEIDRAYNERISVCADNNEITIITSDLSGARNHLVKVQLWYVKREV